MFPTEFSHAQFDTQPRRHASIVTSHRCNMLACCPTLPSVPSSNGPLVQMVVLTSPFSDVASSSSRVHDRMILALRSHPITRSHALSQCGRVDENGWQRQKNSLTFFVFYYEKREWKWNIAGNRSGNGIHGRVTGMGGK